MSYFAFYCRLFICKLPQLGKREQMFLLLLTCNYVVSPLPLGAWDRVRYFIMALQGLSI